MFATFGAAVAVNGPYQDEFRRRVRDIAEDVEYIEFHGRLLHRTVGRHSTRARRLESSLSRKVYSLQGRSAATSVVASRMALGDFGTMQMGVGEGGTMWRGACWCSGLDVIRNSTSSSCRDCLGTRPETLTIAHDASPFRHHPSSPTSFL
jgi:hypothetical protein